MKLLFAFVLPIAVGIAVWSMEKPIYHIHWDCKGPINPSFYDPSINRNFRVKIILECDKLDTYDHIDRPVLYIYQDCNGPINPLRTDPLVSIFYATHVVSDC